jgi:hypothetical protein
VKDHLLSPFHFLLLKKVENALKSPLDDLDIWWNGFSFV